MVLRDGEFQRVDRVSVKSVYGPAPHYPESMTVTMHTESGDEVTATGEVFHNVPLRNRRDGEVARLAEVLVKLQFEGAVGYGISEYHDKMVDGVPLGMTEA